MKHKKYKTNVSNNTKSDFVYFLGIVLYFAVALVGIVVVLAEMAVK